MTDNLVKNCKGDLGTARPHLMAGVPVLWDRIRQGALERVRTAGNSPAFFQIQILNLCDFLRWFEREIIQLCVCSQIEICQCRKPEIPHIRCGESSTTIMSFP
jgi:hypothetical protein